MRNFFKEGYKITNNIIRTLESLNLNTGLYVGGGYSYDSTKYHNNGKVGDLDYVCVVKKVEDIRTITDPVNLNKIGYDLNKIDSLYKVDLDLMEKHLISVIRFSGWIDDIKTTLSFILNEELKFAVSAKHVYRLIPKVTHNKSQNIIVSKGSDGSDIILCMASPEISSDYNDDLKHYIVPDKNYYLGNGYIHTGTLTDLIGKGQIGLDNKLGDLKKYQGEIIRTLVRYSSKSIRLKKEWHKMFSSSHFFSQDYVLKLNNSIDRQLKNIKFVKNQSKKENSKFLFVSFLDESFYTRGKLSKYSMRFESNLTSSEQNAVVDLFTKDINNKLSYENQLHIINAECKRLTTLLHHTINDPNGLYPTLADENLCFTNNDEVLYYDRSLTRTKVLDDLLKKTIESHNKYAKISELASYMFEVRVQFIIKIHEFLQQDIDLFLSSINFKYQNLFKEINERVQNFISKNNS
ncbi:hypothetical protein KC669_04940 [Candidatus Dojkabacteria bacterium]|uniref:Uncharacterized protein n=1 Tax=Candidatus Dojkabacteria bacterium TaxID=2099670 RepID=A0A955LB70_9BACT|nr:hypothetical protein [Candidatus Dojkabacteria bacterium]